VKKLWQVMSIAMLILSTFVLGLSFEIPYKDELGFGPAFFPACDEHDNRDRFSGTFFPDRSVVEWDGHCSIFMIGPPLEESNAIRNSFSVG
jgi:hypothetical protein